MFVLNSENLIDMYDYDVLCYVLEAANIFILLVIVKTINFNLLHKLFFQFSTNGNNKNKKNFKCWQC